MMKTNIAISVAIVFLLIVWESCTTPTPVPQEHPRCTTILYINDFHGHIMPGKNYGGAARLMTVLDAERERARNAGCDSIFVAAGDIMQGTAESVMMRGEAEFRILDRMGLDLMVVGNHDFDYGLKRLNELAQLVSFKIISANTLYKESEEPIFPPYTSIWTDSGLRIGFLGITTTHTPYTTKPSNVEALEFDSPMDVISAYMPILAERSDLLFVLSHAGDSEDTKIAGEISKTNFGVPVVAVIGGHTHKLITPNVNDKLPLVAQAFEHGKVLGVMNVETCCGRVSIRDSRAVAIGLDVPEDPSIKSLINSMFEKMKSKFDQRIGLLDSPISFNRTEHYAHSSKMGSLVADAIRKAAKTELAVINSGAIRAGFPSAKVTYKSLLEVIPYPNSIVVFDITGEKLMLLLSDSWRRTVESSGGGFLQVSGVKIWIENDTISRIVIGDEPLALDKTYTLATISFIANGGDGYYMLSSIPHSDTGITLYDAMVWMFERNGKVSVPEDWSRWIVNRNDDKER